MMLTLKKPNRIESIKIEYAGNVIGAEIVNTNFVAQSGSTGPVTLIVPQGYDYVDIVGAVTENSTSMLYVKFVGDDQSVFYILATPNPSQYRLPVTRISKFTVTFAKIPDNATLTVFLNFFNLPPVGIGSSNTIRLSPDQIPLPVQTAPGDMVVDIDESSLPLWVTSEPTLIAKPEMYSKKMQYKPSSSYKSDNGLTITQKKPDLSKMSKQGVNAYYARNAHWTAANIVSDYKYKQGQSRVNPEMNCCLKKRRQQYDRVDQTNQSRYFIRLHSSSSNM